MIQKTDTENELNDIFHELYLKFEEFKITKDMINLSELKSNIVKLFKTQIEMEKKEEFLGINEAHIKSLKGTINKMSKQITSTIKSRREIECDNLVLKQKLKLISEFHNKLLSENKITKEELSDFGLVRNKTIKDYMIKDLKRMLNILEDSRKFSSTEEPLKPIISEDSCPTREISN